MILTKVYPHMLCLFGILTFEPPFRLFWHSRHYGGLYRGFRDTGYLPFYFQGYRILSILLPGIWDTMFNILVAFRDIDYLRKLIMGIFANL